jgi:predicted ATPase
MLIDGFGFAPYRSFGDELQPIGPLRKINLLIGPNNGGKSNVLRFAHRHLGKLVEAASRGLAYTGFEPIDIHRGKTSGKVLFSYGLALSGHLIHVASSREAVGAWRCKASGPGATKAYSPYVEEQRGRITQQIQVHTASQQKRRE